MNPDFKKALTFWLHGWLGTAIAGSAIGLAFLIPGISSDPKLIIGFFLPMMMGFFLVGITAIPIIVTTAIITWALWLSRFRMIGSAIAGGWSGAFATHGFLASVRHFPWSIDEGTMVVLAGVFGAVGCSTFAYLSDRRKVVPDSKEKNSQKLWQYTLHNLFVRFTMLAVLISLWTWYFTAKHNAWEKDQQIRQQRAKAINDLRRQQGK